jgi:hypothetical protein
MAAAMVLLLWLFESRAAGLAWLLGFAICAAITGLLKLGFLTCAEAWGVGILSPSGHASMSTFVYGALSLIIANQSRRWRVPVLVFGLLWIGAIAVTRVLLHAHTRAEVVIGLIIGLTSLSVFAWKYLRLSHSKLDLRAIGMAGALIFAVLYGVRLPMESFLEKFAGTVRARTLLCHSKVPQEAPRPISFDTLLAPQPPPRSRAQAR